MSPFRPRGSGAPARTRSTRWGGRALCRVLLVGGALLAAAPAVAVDAAGATTTATAGVPIASPAGGYVALGDSFTAGPGVASQLGPGTSPRAPAACLRSSQNYPSLVARALGLALSDMSCSGATTQDLSGSQGPGIPAQLSALGPATSVVSLGIGGNDLGFSTIVANCAAATPWGLTRVGWSCRSHYTAGGSDQLVATVHRVGLKVAGARWPRSGREPPTPGCSSSATPTSSRRPVRGAGPCSRSRRPTSPICAASRTT